MKPIRSATTAAVIGATTASIVTALIFGQTLPSPEPSPTSAVAPTDEPTATTTNKTHDLRVSADETEPLPEPVPDPETPPTEPEPEPEPEPTPTPTPDPELQVQEIGGTIRWANRYQWALVDDRAHTPYGTSHVLVLKDRVRIFYEFGAAEVRDFSVTVDDEFASADVRVGASVGLTYADVFFFMGNSKKRVNPSLLSKKGANVWYSGSFNVLSPPEPAQ
jgi:hypothetical protein